MSTLKLYTEEQIRKAISEAMYALDAKRIMKYIDEHVTPIELPSDEEIYEEGSKWRAPSQAFRGGAKWVIEQILNQNK